MDIDLHLWLIAECLNEKSPSLQANGSLSDRMVKYNFRVFVKGIKNGCPCIVEIRGTQGCALVGDPARAVGECRDVAKAQP